MGVEDVELSYLGLEQPPAVHSILCQFFPLLIVKLIPHFVFLLYLMPLLVSLLGHLPLDIEFLNHLRDRQLRVEFKGLSVLVRRRQFLGSISSMVVTSSHFVHLIMLLLLWIAIPTIDSIKLSPS